jgi:hypothetical protein
MTDYKPQFLNLSAWGLPECGCSCGGQNVYSILFSMPLGNGLVMGRSKELEGRGTKLSVRYNYSQ